MPETREIKCTESTSIDSPSKRITRSQRNLFGSDVADSVETKNTPKKSPNAKEAKITRKRHNATAVKEESTESDPISPVKRIKAETVDLSYFQEDNNCSASTSSQAKITASVSGNYSELKYLEAIGSIRTIRRAKHPGINVVPTNKTNPVSPFVSPESQNVWDRKTKLKISYRVGLLNQDIQFALIVYEPMTAISRRNLMEEFQQAALEEAIAKTPKLLRTKAKSKPTKEKFASPLRRLRF